jgi:glycine dehydrogenase
MAAHEKFKRKMPGRIIGVSVDADGNPAMRMALQTREQHIRREKATSNICTAQVLLAVMAAMYAVYHGPDGLRRIAERIRGSATTLAIGLRRLGHLVVHECFFDTLLVSPQGGSGAGVVDAALQKGINLRLYEDGRVGVALDETVRPRDLDDILSTFAPSGDPGFTAAQLADGAEVEAFPEALARTAPYLEHMVFSRYRSETEMLRYIHRLEAKDLALNISMISLGSCTMKLNATTQMEAVTWPEFGGLHPFAPADQAAG